MCGIFGVSGHQRAAALTHLGLYSLQHRGQESAGIVAVGPDGVARSVRKMGLVSEGFAASSTGMAQCSEPFVDLATQSSRYNDSAHPVRMLRIPLIMTAQIAGS